jgi:small subunit ribosomal protein S17e
MTLDFQTNKKIAEEVAIIPSKRLRNKIAGFATVHFYSWILYHYFC